MNNEKQIIDEDIAWIEKVINEDKRINMDKIKNESKVYQMWKRHGRVPEISFVKGK